MIHDGDCNFFHFLSMYDVFVLANNDRGLKLEGAAFGLGTRVYPVMAEGKSPNLKL